MSEPALNDNVKEEIVSHDRSSLKQTTVADRSNASSRDVFLATVAKGDPKERLKPAATTEKAWKPTADDLAEDKADS
jgi:hypothetical protein